MTDQVSWVLELTVKEGQEAEMRALMAEMVKATKADEPGTLIYEWHFSEDGKTCHLYERYADSTAVMAHLGNFGSKFVERFLGVFTPTRFTVYGSPDPTAREALAGFGPTYMGTEAGFVR